MSAFVPSVLPEQWHLLAFTSCAILVLVGILSGLPTVLAALPITKQKRMGFFWLTVTVVLIGCATFTAALAYRALWLAPNAEATSTQPEEEKSVDDLSKLTVSWHSLRDLLYYDFPGVLHVPGVIKAPFRDSSGEVNIYVVLYQDSRSGSEFFGAYVPPHDKTFEAIKWVLENHIQIMKDLRGNGGSGITTRRAGEHSSPTTIGAKFTGKVYIYYAAPLTLQQLAQLELFAQSHNLSVTFRDDRYLLSRYQIYKNQHRGTR